jgi:hypothetical protein
MVPCESHHTIQTVHTTYAAAVVQKLGAENHMLQLNI